MVCDCLPEYRSHEKGYSRNSILYSRSKGGWSVVQPKKIGSLITCYPAGTQKAKLWGKFFQAVGLISSWKRSYPINPRRKNCIKREPLSGGLSFLCIQRRAENSKELEHKKDWFWTFPCYIELKLLTSLKNMQREQVQTARWCSDKVGKPACLHPY